MLLHMCWPVKDPLQFTKCIKFIQINKPSFLIIPLQSCWLCCTEGRGNSNGKRAFFLLANTVNPTHFYHNEKLFLCLLKGILDLYVA